MDGSGMADARLTQNEVQEVYDGLAWMYDLWGALTERRARRRGIELANVQNGESVLDVAAGTGLILADIIKINPAGLNAGIDISSGMLQKARARLKNAPAHAELRQASAFDIPYPDATFDLLINGYMFDLMPVEAMPKILAEFRRVLKPTGRLVLMNMTVGERPGSHIYEWIYQRSPALMGGCRGVKLAKPLAQVGFQVKVREYHQQFLFPSEVILASPVYKEMF
jgi:ubiquinone/menaquinone biosynthesis C-methylase UbiE